MRIRWTDTAADELREIVAYISRDNREAARRVAKSIYEQVQSLSVMPHRGRPGAIPGTRDLVIHPLRYIVTYEVIRDAVLIVRIRHSSRQWPERLT